MCFWIVDLPSCKLFSLSLVVLSWKQSFMKKYWCLLLRPEILELNFSWNFCLQAKGVSVLESSSKYNYVINHWIFHTSFLIEHKAKLGSDLTWLYGHTIKWFVNRLVNGNALNSSSLIKYVQQRNVFARIFSALILIIVTVTSEIILCEFLPVLIWICRLNCSRLYVVQVATLQPLKDILSKTSWSFNESQIFWLPSWGPGPEFINKSSCNCLYLF